MDVTENFYDIEKIRRYWNILGFSEFEVKVAEFCPSNDIST